jgi:hypothetical protein
MAYLHLKASERYNLLLYVGGESLRSAVLYESEKRRFVFSTDCITGASIPSFVDAGGVEMPVPERGENVLPVAGRYLCTRSVGVECTAIDNECAFRLADLTPLVGAYALLERSLLYDTFEVYLDEFYLGTYTANQLSWGYGLQGHLVVEAIVEKIRDAPTLVKRKEKEKETVAVVPIAPVVDRLQTTTIYADARKDVQAVEVVHEELGDFKEHFADMEMPIQVLPAVKQALGLQPQVEAYIRPVMHARPGSRTVVGIGMEPGSLDARVALSEMGCISILTERMRGGSNVVKLRSDEDWSSNLLDQLSERTGQRGRRLNICGVFVEPPPEGDRIELGKYSALCLEIVNKLRASSTFEGPYLFPVYSAAGVSEVVNLTVPLDFALLNPRLYGVVYKDGRRCIGGPVVGPNEYTSAKLTWCVAMKEALEKPQYDDCILRGSGLGSYVDPGGAVSLAGLRAFKTWTSAPVALMSTAMLHLLEMRYSALLLLCKPCNRSLGFDPAKGQLCTDDLFQSSFITKMVYRIAGGNGLPVHDLDRMLGWTQLAVLLDDDIDWVLKMYLRATVRAASKQHAYELQQLIAALSLCTRQHAKSLLLDELTRVLKGAKQGRAHRRVSVSRELLQSGLAVDQERLNANMRGLYRVLKRYVGGGGQTDGVSVAESIEAQQQAAAAAPAQQVEPARGRGVVRGVARAGGTNRGRGAQGMRGRAQAIHLRRGA